MENEIRIEVLSKKHIIEAANCLAEGFLREPMTLALDIEFVEILEFTQHAVSKTVNEGLSLVAVDVDSDSVIGVSINKDLLDELVNEDDVFLMKLSPIFNLLEQLDEEYRANHEVKRNEIFHGLMIVADQKSKFGNIAFQLLEKSYELAKENDFSKMMVEATGPISQNVAAKKLGFTEFASVNYSDFEFEGDRIFSEIIDVSTCKLLVKEL